MIGFQLLKTPQTFLAVKVMGKIIMSTVDMLVGRCERCGGILEFKIAQVGQSTCCYHCGLETALQPSLDCEPDPVEPPSAGQSLNVNTILVCLAALAVVWNLLFLASLVFPTFEARIVRFLNQIPLWPD